ncbi:hypothetical protein [Teredinibacter sp. KSP-S5-2]|uniref:hypothetical protein n=1 Tax=Teredinibacter sp. KSP-S5-2 TaxID=3034506 RepID=UPI0029351B85|nr:hypothetical protein [Teredinibacter sp. KSP-S5-2]WNO08884.1 hypothetical protein P5V12_18090 [Teredinibacter sp. KSP-S5-2]
MDHHNVNYGPDHIYNDLINDKKGVESSFTLESPLVGLPKIIEIIQKLEVEDSE